MDSRTIQQTMDALASKASVTKEQMIASKASATKEQMIARFASLNFLKIPASISDTAKAAVFLAPDWARMMTGTVVNSMAGAAAD